jgi:hypothetical protein
VDERLPRVFLLVFQALVVWLWVANTVFSLLMFAFGPERLPAAQPPETIAIGHGHLRHDLPNASSGAMSSL